MKSTEGQMLHVDDSIREKQERELPPNPTNLEVILLSSPLTPIHQQIPTKAFTDIQNGVPPPS